MKKSICIFLLAWLPLFISAASAASLQMTLANLNADTQEKVADTPSCHQHLNATQDHSKAPNSSQHHVCPACGFCVIASGFAHITPHFSVQTSNFTAPQPTFFAAVFHSQTYPPAIRPPIFN